MIGLRRFINLIIKSTTGIACKNLNRKFIGIELDKGYFEIARTRIYDLVKGE